MHTLFESRITTVKIITIGWEDNGKTDVDKGAGQIKNKSGAMMSCSRGTCDSGANDRGLNTLKCTSSRRRPHSWHSSMGSPHHHRTKRIHGKWFIPIIFLWCWNNKLHIVVFCAYVNIFCFRINNCKSLISSFGLFLWCNKN